MRAVQQLGARSACSDSPICVSPPCSTIATSLSAWGLALTFHQRQQPERNSGLQAMQSMRQHALLCPAVLAARHMLRTVTVQRATCNVNRSGDPLWSRARRHPCRVVAAARPPPLSCCNTLQRLVLQSWLPCGLRVPQRPGRPPWTATARQWRPRGRRGCRSLIGECDRFVGRLT